MLEQGLEVRLMSKDEPEGAAVDAKMRRMADLLRADGKLRRV
jgi:hypothetical protein